MVEVEQLDQLFCLVITGQGVEVFMRRLYCFMTLCVLSHLCILSSALAEDVATPELKTSQTYTMKDLAVKMNSEEVEVFAKKFKLKIDW